MPVGMSNRPHVRWVRGHWRWMRRLGSTAFGPSRRVKRHPLSSSVRRGLLNRQTRLPVATGMGLSGLVQPQVFQDFRSDASVDHRGWCGTPILNACDHFHSGCVQFAAALLAFLDRAAFGSMANTRFSRCAHPRAAPIGRSHSVCPSAHP